MSVSSTKNDYLPFSIQIISLDNTWEFAEEGYFHPCPHEISADLNTFISCIKMMQITEVTFYIGYIIINDYVQFIFLRLMGVQINRAVILISVAVGLNHSALILSINEDYHSFLVYTWNDIHMTSPRLPEGQL